jgi:2'-5' RNA ligase
MVDSKIRDKQQQYFIALVPPSPIYEKANDLKLHFKERYNSKAALNSPPHITLHMPFWWKKDKEDQLIKGLSEFSPIFFPFQLSLRNFSAFKPRVIFIDIVPNESLMKLQKELMRFCKKTFNLFNADYKALPFHPHLTLAFRDLKKVAFEEAWEEFREKTFDDNFIVDHFTLLRHNGKRWEPINDFAFKPPSGLPI